MTMNMRTGAKEETPSTENIQDIKLIFTVSRKGRVIFDLCRCSLKCFITVIFSQASIILSIGGLSAPVHAWIHTHPPGRHPLRQTPPSRHSRADSPWADIPLGKSPLGPWENIPSRQTSPQADIPSGRHTPAGRHPLPVLGRYPPRQTHPQADTSGQTPRPGSQCSGRYASYWNAFLLKLRIVFRSLHSLLLRKKKKQDNVYCSSIF